MQIIYIFLDKECIISFLMYWDKVSYFLNIGVSILNSANK
jgi:hypothetical protein